MRRGEIGGVEAWERWQFQSIAVLLALLLAV